MSIFNQYFEITKKYRDEYGTNTILLMQVGGFYELYGLHDEKGNYIDKYSKFSDICLYCGLKMTDKELGGEKFNDTLAMAGFRTYSLEKYLKTIIDAGYACVVYDQDEQKSGTTRSLKGIYTPGTYFDNEDSKITNTIMCCWTHKYKNIIVIGASCIDVLTGKSYIYEYDRIRDISPETFDELERFVSTFMPNEIIIIHNIEQLDSLSVVDLINIPQKIRTGVIHISDSKINHIDDGAVENKNTQKKRALNCSKQIYQDEIYKRFFNGKFTKQTTDMMNTYAIASQSYCFLLDYVNQNNPHLIKNIELPIFENKSERVMLGNHSLKQLNIIQTQSKYNQQTKYSTSYIESYSGENNLVKKRHSSLCDLLNYCKTPMGTRLFYYTMTHPHSDIKLLNKIYDTTEYCSEPHNNDICNSICCSLGSVVDIEKIIRKIYINRISYDDISKLYSTLVEINNIGNALQTSIETYSTIKDYVSALSFISIDNVFAVVNDNHNLLNKIFNNTITSATSCEYTNIFNLGVYKSHDDKVIEYYKYIYQLKIVYYYFIEQLKLAEKKTTKSKKEATYKRDPIKINETERGNITIELTNQRATALSNYLARENIDKTYKKRRISDKHSELHKRVLDENIIPDYLIRDPEFTEKCFEDVYIDDDIVFEKSASNGQKTIRGTLIDKILKNTQSSKTELEASVKIHFNVFIEEFKKNIKDFDIIIKFCSHIDMLMCYREICVNTNYCKPTICDSRYSFCDLKNVRHPLIEHLLEQDIYVANSIIFNVLSDNPNENVFNAGQGFLMYGTNTVGKSSFIKSIGIAVIMAQCGFYVPAESMTYKPYRSIFTRILGNDDLFRGLSTFNVEMIELKNILNYADENSLVLGDEVCSGTEIGSASSIFMSAIENLYNKKANFMFATHFHNITECEEIKALVNMKSIHLSVKYDVEKDKLIYDRKLKEGAGENMYGLEVCKYLHLPNDFIKRSYEIRNKYFAHNSSILDLKGSKYNSRKLVGNCERCGQKGDEVHHLQYQRNSDEKGFIKNNSIHRYFHKNNKANLMVLCSNCHNKLHEESKSGHYRVSDELHESK